MLGILGIICCIPAGPAAWYLASKELESIDAGILPETNRTTAKVAKVLGILGTIVFVAGVAFAIFGPKSPDSPRTSERRSNPRNDAAEAEASDVDLTVSANKITADYEANEIAADDTYKGKRVRVRGTVEKVGKDILDSPYVVLKGSGLFRGVQCSLARNQTARAADLTAGDEVVMEGTVSGLMMNVQINNCSFQ